MYYRRYFEGTVASTSVTEARKIGYAASNTTVYKNQTDVVGNALAQVLRDIGFTAAVWEPVKCIAWFDSDKKTGLGIYFSSSSAFRLLYSCNDTTGYKMASISTSAQNPFSGTNYKFYLTVKGEPTKGFEIYLGSYSNPVLESDHWGCLFAKDEISGHDVNIQSVSYSSTFSGVSVIDMADGTEVTTTEGNFNYVSLGNCSSQPGVICLSPPVLYWTFITFGDGIYGGSKALSPCKFYEIDGEEYYARLGIGLVKCTTPPPT